MEKYPMIKIINEIIEKRLFEKEKTRFEKTDNIRLTIQLSSCLMNKYADELYSFTNNEFDMRNYKTSEFGKEIVVKSNDFIFTVRNREYRDNTNDPEVEEALYDLINRSI